MDNIKEVLADAAFVNTLLTLETPDEIQAALKEKGIELTEAAAAAIREKLAGLKNGELAEDLLDKIAGGTPDIQITIADGFSGFTGFYDPFAKMEVKL